MDTDDRPDKPNAPEKQGFLATLVQWIIRDTVRLWIPVFLGTVVGAVICLYIGAPIIFSLLGGVLVLAVYVAWDSL